MKTIKHYQQRHQNIVKTILVGFLPAPNVLPTQLQWTNAGNVDIL